jgi:hypothetical protein
MRKLLFNCQKHGHKIDNDWPTDVVMVKTPKNEHFAYGLGRCLECGCFYSYKSTAPAPSGLVNTAGKAIIP